MSTALALVAPREMDERGYTAEDVATLKATMGKDLNDAQFKVFIAACNRLGLDAFAKQITCWKGQGGGIVVQVTIDGLRAVAMRTKEYVAQYGPEWCGKDGVFHQEWVDDLPPAGARFGVKRRGQEAVIWGFARYKSYNKGGNWASMPDVMIAKVAESLALRRAFPHELSGVYVREEIEAIPPGEREELGAEDQALYDALPQQTRESLERASAAQEYDAAAYAHEARLAGEAISERIPLGQPSEADGWVNLRARMHAVHITTKRDADALCRQACGKPWEQCRTDGDYAAVERAVALLERAEAARHAAVKANVEAAERVPADALEHVETPALMP